MDPVLTPALWPTAHAPLMTPVAQEPPLVLIVEDDEKLAALIERILYRAGYAVMVASTGDEALRSMRDRRPQAVVVDVMIPHPDGIELCRKFRRDGWPGPMIAISARSSPDHQRRTLEAGADRFLGKPFRLSDLVETLERIER